MVNCYGMARDLAGEASVALVQCYSGVVQDIGVVGSSSSL